MTTVIPKVSRLSQRVIRILGCNPSPMTLQGTNTYLIGTGEKRILLDTGNPQVPEYIDSLKAVLEENHTRLEKIIVTHWHADHIGGVNDIRSNIDKSLSAHKFSSITHDKSPNVTKYQVLSDLKDGQQITTEGATLKIVHTPGHTDDHIVLVLEEENAVFSGDCILGEGTCVFEDLFTYMNSLQAILTLAPNIIYPGHGPVIEDPLPCIQQYIAHRQQRENQVVEVLKQSYPKAMTPMQLVHLIYVDTPKQLYKPAALNVSHHLTKLVKENKVCCVAENDIVKYKLKENAST